MKTTRTLIYASMLLNAGCGDQGTTPPGGANPPPSAEAKWEPLQASESYAGRTTEEWAIEWSRWAYSQTSCESAFTDIDGSECGLYQDPDSPVFFMATAPSRAPRTECRVPYGKAIVAPLAVISNDNAGVDPPQTDEEMRDLVSEVFDSIRDLELKADGIQFDDLEERSFGPIEYTYSVPASPNYYSCRVVDGVENMIVDPGFLAGYLAIFPPPEPGRHRLSYFGVMSVFDTVNEIGADMRFVVEER
jgi:hypothetical protein